jgi:VWFA-related protein
MRWFTGFAVVLFVTASAVGQAVPTFRSRTELVLVPVKVTKSKRHVAGLQRQQFRILEDGVERNIASFEEVRSASSAPAQAPELPSDTFSNQPVASGPGHLTIFLMDLLNTPVMYHDKLRKDTVHYLETHANDGPFMVTVLSCDGLHIIQNYSADPQVVLKALDRIRLHRNMPTIEPADMLPLSPPLTVRLPSDMGQIRPPSDAQNSGGQEVGAKLVDPAKSSSALGFNNPRNEFLALARAYQQASVIELSLDALTQLANSLAAIPGRKSLIWIGGGLPDLYEDLRLYQGGRFLYTREKFNQTWAALNAANIAVYPVSAVQPDNPVWTPPSFPSMRGSRVMVPSSIFVPLSDRGAVLQMAAFAEETGGTMCGFENDYGNCFKKVVADSADYYMLSYYTSGERRPGWHKIKVKVDVPHTSVRAREGYMLPAANQDASAAQRVQINTALGSPLDFTTLPLTLRWAPPERNGQAVRASFALMLNAQSLTLADAASNHLKFDLVFLAFNEHGKRVGKITQTVDLHPTDQGIDKMLREGIRYTNYLDLAAGQYTVRIVVRDAQSGKVGSLTVPLKLS